MKVSGTIQHNYLFQPEYGELKQFRALFAGKVKPTKDGWTLRAYDDIPQFLVKDQVLLDMVAAKTRSFDNETETLHNLKLGVTPGTSQILDVSQGIYTPNFKIQSVNNLGYMTNTIPQVYAIVPNSSDPNRMIIALEGDYDFNSGMFEGTLDFLSLEEVWNE